MKRRKTAIANAISSPDDLRIVALADLKAPKCPVCGRAKDADQGFCRGCQMKLPSQLRYNLRGSSIATGYADFHHAAKQFLVAARAPANGGSR